MNRETDVKQKKRKNNANYYCRNDYFVDVNMTHGDYVLEYKITNHFWLSVWNRSIVIHFVWSRFLNRNNDDNIINIFFCLYLSFNSLGFHLVDFCSSNTSNDFQWEICWKVKRNSLLAVLFLDFLRFLLFAFGI